MFTRRLSVFLSVCLSDCRSLHGNFTGNVRNVTSDDDELIKF